MTVNLRIYILIRGLVRYPKSYRIPISISKKLGIGDIDTFANFSQPLLFSRIYESKNLYFDFQFSEDLCGIFVKSVIEGSIADLSGSIMVNDQITEVNGTSLSGRSNQEAVEILKQTGSSVNLTIVRYLRGLKFEELQDGIKAANATTPNQLASPVLSTPLPPVNDYKLTS